MQTFSAFNSVARVLFVFFLALFSGFRVYIPWLFRWFTPRTFGRTVVRISYSCMTSLHSPCWVGIFTHIYLSTIGEPGTFGSMIRGAVSEAWTWTCTRE